MIDERTMAGSDAPGVSRVWAKLAGRVVRMRGDLVVVALDIALTASAFTAMLMLRYDASVPDDGWSGLATFMPIAMLTVVVSNLAWGLYGQLWRHASLYEAMQLVKSGRVGDGRAARDRLGAAARPDLGRRDRHGDGHVPDGPAAIPEPPVLVPAFHRPARAGRRGDRCRRRRRRARVGHAPQPASRLPPGRRARRGPQPARPLVHGRSGRGQHRRPPERRGANRRPSRRVRHDERAAGDRPPSGSRRRGSRRGAEDRARHVVGDARRRLAA